MKIHFVCFRLRYRSSGIRLDKKTRKDSKSQRSVCVVLDTHIVRGTLWFEQEDTRYEARTDSHTTRRCSFRPPWSPLVYLAASRSRAQPAQQLQSRSLPSASWNAVVPLYTDAIHQLSSRFQPSRVRNNACDIRNTNRKKETTSSFVIFFSFFFFFSFRLIELLVFLRARNIRTFNAVIASIDATSRK